MYVPLQVGGVTGVPTVSIVASRRQQISDFISQHPEYGGLDPAARDDLWDTVSTEHPNTSSRVDMRRYDVRMATYSDNTLKWTLRTPSPEHLARVGFYYIGIEDRVRCFSCDVELEDWMEEGTPEPLLRHYLAKPHCSFLQQDFHDQLPRLKELANTQHSKYANTSLRLHSFAQWPFGHVVTSYQLASVGFYYTGQGAKVICFSCGLEIKEWKRGDVPLLVHCRQNPDCPFISSIVKKGTPSSASPQAPPPMLKPLATLDSSTAANKPDFSDLNIRLKSFKKLSPLFPIPRQQLAEAGLFLLRLPDVMKCFSCGVIVQDWVEGDTAVEKHRGVSVHCSYLAEKFPNKLDLSSHDFDPNSLPGPQFNENDLEQMARQQLFSSANSPPSTETFNLPISGLSLSDVHPYTAGPTHMDPSLPTMTSSLATPTSGDPQPLSLTATLTPSNPPSTPGSSGYYSNAHSSAHTGSQSSFSTNPSHQSSGPYSHLPPSLTPPSSDHLFSSLSTAEVGGKSVSLPPSYSQATPATHAHTLPSTVSQVKYGLQSAIYSVALVELGMSCDSVL